ncbi:hybrid sensor histidine kinase/response regulator [Arundinibacter roseus]|uniref:histidine kinase n=1 Tax=Arundinibacter roseus TaxID=2070510 RepID=A0A4R4KBD4_9BACT|nr:hybrid sensor histidine kinase/response regulator [Arundinibacter roseus]TDB65184.1 hybrid sensor histidine kinase/response regulator [Arundinibacter roseus]
MNQDEPLHVLLVDDDEDDFLLTSEYFKDLTNWNFKIQWCPTYERAVDYLTNCRHDIYIFDYLLGSRTGIDLIEEAVAQNCQEPIILLTGKGDEKIALEALRVGAADYLVKSELEVTILERSLRYALERTKVIKALRKSERRYRRIFEESKDMLFISDLQGNILDFNAASLSLTGFSEAELQSKTIPDFFEEGEMQTLWENIREQKDLIDQEVRLVTKQGEKRFGIFSATIEKDLEFTYVQGRFHDVTLQKQSERERLFSEKLAVTSRLVRMLAHEVRNPLTNVNLSAEQLESEIEDEGLIFYIDIIKRNCSRINDLITQLLQSSRSEELNLSPGSLHAILDQTLDSAIDRLQLKSIQVEKHYHEKDAVILLDENTFKIALLNLITNAIEAMENGKGTLRIITRQTDQEVQVLIADNGSGISEANMTKIFEPYFTVKKSGMGIGLASTLNIVQSHKGRIDVQSEEGIGTVFTLSFPLEITQESL